MSSASAFVDAIRRAVTPGPERLLAGVALGAATTRKRDDNSEGQDYLAAYGTQQLDPASPPVSTKTVMWIASCTKLVTTVAAMQCVEKGLFSLDDPTDIDRLLPEWKDPKILTGWTDGEEPVVQPAKEKITLRRLLTHTSGVAYDFLTPSLIRWRRSRGGEGLLAMAAPITKCFTTPLLFEPGSAFMYGAGLDLAGLMVARANDCTLEYYMRKHIFDVLGMNETSFYIKHNDIGKRLMPMTTRTAPNEPLIDGYAPNVRLKLTQEPKDEFGGGGLFSTTEDFLKLLKSLLRNDGRLVKTENVDLMFTSSISTPAKNSLNDTLSVPVYAGTMIPGEPPAGTPGAGEWTHGLGGVMALHDRKDGLKAGNMRWGGAPNLKWWIDRKGGTCGIFSTQLFPSGEDRHAFLGRMFQEEMVARYA